MIHGMVDPHVHLRGMEWSHKSTFYSETCAAVAGGYWAVMDMPNTPPHTLNRANLDHKLAEIGAQAVCDWGVYFCASALGNWDEYPNIINDVCGIKMFNDDTTGHLLVEDESIREGHYTHWDGRKIFANHAEDETCAKIIELVRKYRKPTHILHVCTAYEVGIIRQAKTDGLPITCGVCPHHIFLTENDLPRLGTLGWMKPTLKTQADQDALWRGLADGTIDVVESDHAPHRLTEKESDKPPYGVPGLETTLPLMLTAVHDGRISLEKVVDLVANNPRKIWGLTCPPDTYCVVDFDDSYVLSRQNLRTQVGWSPFEGMRLYGRVRENWIRDTQVYDGEKILVSEGFGINLYG